MQSRELDFEDVDRVRREGREREGRAGAGGGEEEEVHHRMGSCWEEKESVSWRLGGSVI